MYQVLYCSRRGSTRKVAEAIAAELGVTAADVITASPDTGAKVIFLGSGRYGGTPGQEMQKFIEANNFKGRKVAYFSTCWFVGLNRAREAEFSCKALEKKGAIMLGDYHCPGKFVLFNRGRPDEEDLKGARKFAREIVKLA